MILPVQVKEIKKHLEESENPLFLFDDDHDGLASFLILWKHIKRGHGVVVKGPPKVDISYLSKIHEYKADKVFILDKPVLPQEFIDKAKIPIIYIDHHQINKLQGAHYYNPHFHDKDDNSPVAYWAYKVAENDMWISIVGSVGDYYIPEYMDEFKKHYPDLLPKKINTEEIMHNSELGKLVQIFNFILKGTTSDTNKCIKVLTRIESPYEILRQESPRGKFIYRHFEKINKKYQRILDDALKTKSRGKVLVYTYTSKDSFTGPISNYLRYKYPKKIIIIARVKEDRIIMSFRSNTIELPSKINNALEGIDGYGGGHAFAAAASIPKDDFKKFIAQFKVQV